MTIKPKLIDPEYRLIMRALRAFSLQEMERVAALPQSNERAARSFEAGLAAGLALRIEACLPKEKP